MVTFEVYAPDYYRGQARCVRRGGVLERALLPRPDGTGLLGGGPLPSAVVHGDHRQAYEVLLDAALVPGEMYVDMAPRRRPGDVRNAPSPNPENP